jgi:hypothetical protein
MDTCTGWSKVRCDVLVGLLPVLLPNLVLTGLGLLMRGQAQRVAEAQAVGHFGTERFLRQVGLNAFFLLLVGIWLWRRRVGWTVCGWRRERSSRVVGLGVCWWWQRCSCGHGPLPRSG